jgi:hypothetical protein
MILGYESFDQTKAMIESADVADAVVAFEVLEQADLLENLVYILILFKDTNASIVTWQQHAPKTTKNIQSLYGLTGNASPAMSMKGILKKATQYKVEPRQMEFLLMKYAEFLSTYLPPKYKVTITLNERTEI